MDYRRNLKTLSFPILKNKKFLQIPSYVSATLNPQVIYFIMKP